MASEMMQVEIVLTAADKKVTNKLKALGQELTNLKETMDGIGEMVAEFAEGPVYMSAGGILGQPWKPLSDKYKLYKGKHALSNNLLVFTGKMKDSFAWTAKENSVEVGNNAPYWQYTQLGTSKMAARPTIGFTDDLRDKIKLRIHSDIKRRIELASL